MKMLRSALIWPLLAVVLPALSPAGAAVQTIVDFEDGLPPDTEEHRFAGQTQYRVVKLGQCLWPDFPDSFQSGRVAVVGVALEDRRCCAKR